MRLTKSYLKKYLVINTTNKEENQIIVKNINTNKIKLDEQKRTSLYDWVIQPSY